MDFLWDVLKIVDFCGHTFGEQGVQKVLTMVYGGAMQPMGGFWQTQQHLCKAGFSHLP